MEQQTKILSAQQAAQFIQNLQAKLIAENVYKARSAGYDFVIRVSQIDAKRVSVTVTKEKCSC